MKTGFEELVYSVTMRCYCTCGGAMHINSDLEGTFQAVEAFWSQHTGFGHKPTTPAKSQRVRARLARDPMISQEG